MGEYEARDPYAKIVYAFRDGGDPDHQLLKRALLEVERYICSLGTHSREDIEDYCLITIERACEKIEKFRWESQFMTWVKKIAFYVVQEGRRKHSGSYLPLQDEDVMLVPTEEDMEERIILEMAYGEAVGQLDELEQRVVHLRLASGIPFKDIALQCDVPIITAQRAFYRAQKKIESFWIKNQWYDAGKKPALRLTGDSYVN